MKYIFLTFFAIGVCPSSFAFEVIAHRGVHQTYTRENLDNETCTASRIEQTGHQFIENTTASIRKAFELGATMVEFDIHPTQEQDGQEGKMAVFHDWTLDCRTEARCESGCTCENSHCITHLHDLESWKFSRITRDLTIKVAKAKIWTSALLPALEVAKPRALSRDIAELDSFTEKTRADLVL